MLSIQRAMTIAAILWIGPLFAEDTRTPLPEILRWGIIGFSPHCQSAIIPAIKESPHCFIDAVASLVIGEAAEMASDFGISKSFNTYQPLLDDPNIDIIYLALPPFQMKEWAIKAAKAGKHVVCRKLLEPTASSYDEVIQEFEKYGVLLIQTYRQRYSEILQKLTDSYIGDVSRVHISLNTPEISNENALWDLASDALCLIQNIVLLNPTRVVVSLFSDPHQPEENQLLHAIMACSSGSTAVIDCGTKSTMPFSLELFGTEGRLYLQEMEDDHPLVMQENIISAFDERKNFVRYVKECLEGEMDTSLDNSRMLDAMMQSSRSTSPVSL